MPLLHLRSLAFLYVDPGSGSLIWQFLTAGLFAAIFYLRRVFRRPIALKSKVDSTPSRGSSQPEVND